MRRWLTWGVWILAGTSACTGQAPQVAPTLTQPALVRAELPPTWTPTVRSPSPMAPTVVSTAEPGTPTPTPTPTTTATSSELEVTILPSPTTDFTAMRCAATTNEEGIELLRAPFVLDYHILPTMEPGYAYQAVEQYPTYVRLMRDGQTAGWVDYRLLALDFEGPDCFYQPYFEGELTAFELCFMRADPPVDTYLPGEEDLGPFGSIGPDSAFVLAIKAQEQYSSCMGHAGPCFVVDASAVELYGQCDDLPRSAETIAEAELWSQPDPSLGTPILTLPSGTRVAVQVGSVAGAPPPGAPGEGVWLQVKLTSTYDRASGWLWSTWIEYR